MEELELGDPEARITKVSIIPHGESLFHEKTIHVEIEDEAAGEYLTITGNHEYLKQGQIAIDVIDWPVLKKTIDDMIEQCRS